MHWKIIVKCIGEDGKRSTITLGTVERVAGRTTAENLGVQPAGIESVASAVVKQQVHERCEQRRRCPTCGRQRETGD
jgi:hypothetical protein